MASKEIEDSFKARLAAVLQDLSTNGTKDKEAMLMLGSLASNLVDSAEVKNWIDLKASIDEKGFEAMLNSLEKEGNKLIATGKIKAAYAIQAIGTSLVANKMKDKDTATGRDLLDSLIEQAIINFKNQPAKTIN